jgi:hypothetical protein
MRVDNICPHPLSATILYSYMQNAVSKNHYLHMRMRISILEDVVRVHTLYIYYVFYIFLIATLFWCLIPNDVVLN